MKNNRKKVNNANVDILSTVSLVDVDEVVKRNNNEYIYLDAERGIIVQPEEVETVKNRQAVDVLKNLLLGSFNAETGKYEISNNIELELKEVVKTETSRNANAVFCESLSAFGGLGKLQFVVKTSVENGEALSQLFIFERVKKMSKTVVNTQIQLVAEYKRYNETYKDFDSLTFENYYRFAWEEFKIVKKNQMFYLSEDEKFLQGWIIRRKLYLKSMGLILDPYIDAAESELLLTRIEILSGLGTYGYKVLERFEELKNQAKKIVGEQELAARDQNEILEEAIETFRGQFDKEQTDFFKKQVSVVRDYAETVANVKEKNHKEVLNDIEVRMPTVVEIIKRDDEAKKVSAMARLDAEVASIEAGAKPTTKQVAQNAKQAAEQTAKQVVKPNEQQSEEQATTEQKGKTAKRGKPAETTQQTQPTTKGKTTEAQTDAKTQTTETKKPATTETVKKNDKQITNGGQGNSQGGSSNTTPWTYEPPKKVDTDDTTTSGLNAALAAAIIANSLQDNDDDDEITTTDYLSDSDYDYGVEFVRTTTGVKQGATQTGTSTSQDQKSVDDLTKETVEEIEESAEEVVEEVPAADEEQQTAELSGDSVDNPLAMAVDSIPDGVQDVEKLRSQETLSGAVEKMPDEDRGFQQETLSGAVDKGSSLELAVSTELLSGASAEYIETPIAGVKR